jgi:hypothetical protein
MNIAGIDFSTRAIDVVTIDLDNHQPPRWERHELEGPDAWERTRQVKFWSLTDPDDVLAIGLEEPRGQSAGVLYRVQGALLARLPSTVLVYPWVPSEWRRAVGLSGRASKEAVSRWAERNGAVPLGHWVDHPGTGGSVKSFHMPPFDATDAFCIARATRLALSRPNTEETAA